MKSKLVYIASVIALILLTVGMASVMRARAMAWTDMKTRTIPPFEVGNAESEAAQVGTYDYAYKFDNWGPGTTFPWSETHGGNTITITSSNGTHFDWSSDFPISAVIVKGGTAVNIFYYDPAATSDTLLYAPINPNTEMPYGISHVTFCWNVPDQEIPEVPLGTVAAIVSMMFAFAAYFTLRKPKSIQL
jgi:hypothetical protein